MALFWNLGLPALVSLIIFSTFVYAIRRGLIVFEEPVTDVVKQGWELEAIKEERYRLMEDLTEANRKIRKLEHGEESLRQRIEELEKELLRFSPRADLPTTPLLLICSDVEFCSQDTTQLNRARVWFRTIEDATKREVSEELSRRRQNGDLYPWIHIAAHGNTDGILLSDEIARPEWWNTQLEGVKVIFAANCDSVEVGDALAGVVDFVVVFYGPRNSDDVARFTYSFWSEMMKDSNVRVAYRKALIIVPQIRAFVDLRTK